MEVKAIDTYYNGYKFRSRLEARWAVFFDAIGVKYEYEPEGLLLHDGTKYLPDFYLPQFKCYFEVKRNPGNIWRSCLPDDPEFAEAIRKIRSGMENDEWAGIICFGDPYDHTMFIFCQEYNDSSGGSYDGMPVVFGHWINTRDPMLFSWWDCRDRTFLTTFGGDSFQIPMITDCDYQYLENPFVTKRIIDAELKARQARFEHGESPR